MVQQININSDAKSTAGLQKVQLLNDPLFPGIQPCNLNADPTAPGVIQATLTDDPLTPGLQYFMAESDPLAASLGTPEVMLLGSMIGTGLADTGTADATNLLLSTQQNFAGPDWPNFDDPKTPLCTMADINSLAPDSTSTGSTLTETAITSQHRIRQGVYVSTSALPYTFAISLKQGLRTRGAIYIIDSTPPANANFAGAVFDLSGGVIGVAAAVTGNFTLPSATITAQSNGWYLCTLTTTIGTLGKLVVSVYADSGSGVGAASLSYAGNAGSVAISVWGAALYQASAATAYAGLQANKGLAATTTQQLFVPNGTTTNYWGTRTLGAWLGYDFGVPVQLTRWRFAPRPSPTTLGVYPWAPDWAKTIQGSLVQTSVSDNTFASPTTVDTVPVDPYYHRFWLSERPIPQPAVASRYARVMPPSKSFGGFSAIQFFGKQGTTANAQPVQPVISPMGGRFPAANPVVTITTTTIGCQIYYTTDGSTPTTSSTLYTGPFTLSMALGATATVKAIANLASLSTPLSLITTSPPFCRYGIKPDDNWYDDKGNLIEAHAGSISWDPLHAAYYWFGQTQNVNSVVHYSTTPEPNGFPISWLYKSTDLLNWTITSAFLNDPFTTQPIGGRYHLLFNAANQNWVVWSMFLDMSANSSVYYASTTDHNIEGQWTWNLTPIVSNTFFDFDLFIDSDGVTAWAVWRDSNTTNKIQQLNASYTGLTGASLTLTNVGVREGPILFKYPFATGGTYFLITSGAVPYDSAPNADMRYTSNTGATPIVNTWNAVPSSGASIWAVSQTGTQFNGQGTFHLNPQTKIQPMVGLDFWTPTPNYNSRQVWLPVAILTSTTMQVNVPADWNPRELGTSAGQLSGSVALFTTNQTINLTALAATDWISYGFGGLPTSIERKLTGGSLISTLSQIGTKPITHFNYNGTLASWQQTWTDGTPDVAETAESHAEFVAVLAGEGPGPGFAFSVIADTTVRTLKVYVVSSWVSTSTQGKFTANLSDESALPYTDTSVTSNTVNTMGVYTIVYAAASNGQTLNLTWTNNTANAQNVVIQAITLS